MCVCVCMCVCTHTITDTLTFSNLENLSTSTKMVITSYLLWSSDLLRDPRLIVGRVTNSAVEYQVQKKWWHNQCTNNCIWGEPLWSTNDRRVCECRYIEGGELQSALQYIPNAQYRITAWALGGGTRSAIPAVQDVTTGEASVVGMCISKNISGHEVYCIGMNCVSQ